jgi:RNA recognition motif-containing protein
MADAKNNPACRTLFIGDLPTFVKDKVLAQLFSQSSGYQVCRRDFVWNRSADPDVCENSQGCRVRTDRKGTQVGFVDFDDKPNATKARQEHENHTFSGASKVLAFCVPALTRTHP